MQGPVVPLDVSWHMPGTERDPHDEWKIKRLPRARFLDLDQVADLDHPLRLPHMMPTASVFAQACRNLGITPQSHVVLYDSVGIFSSPRALFMFKAFGHQKASVLNGGLPGWEAAGYPIEEGDSQLRITATEYPEPHLKDGFVWSYDEVRGNTQLSSMNKDKRIIVDARSQARFDGTGAEPRPGLPSGHIPGSLSLPFDRLREVVQPNTGSTFTRLKGVGELKMEFSSVLKKDSGQLVESNQGQLVTSCGSGMSAGILWLALQQMGVHSALYDESWMGYAARKESLIERTEVH